MGQEYQRQSNIIGLSPTFGPLLFLTDFTHRPILGLSGTGAYSGHRTISRYLTSSSSLLLSSRPTGITVNDYVAFTHDILFSRSSKIYAKFVTMPSGDDADGTFRFLIYILDGITQYQAGLQFDAEATTFQYLDLSNTWTTIPGDSGELNLDQWNTFSFSFDLNSGLYIDFITNSLAHPVNNLLFRKLADSGAPYSYVSHRAIVGTTANNVVKSYTDSILISNQPF